MQVEVGVAREDLKIVRFQAQRRGFKGFALTAEVASLEQRNQTERRNIVSNPTDFIE